jgi:hypothetical protein
MENSAGVTQLPPLAKDKHMAARIYLDEFDAEQRKQYGISNLSHTQDETKACHHLAHHTPWATNR